MIILINALSARRGGGQTYIYNLLKYVPPIDVVDKIILLGPKNLNYPKNHPNILKLHVSKIAIYPITRIFWELICLPFLVRRYKVNVLFCPGGLINIIGCKSCKKVAMFRNMIPFDKSQVSKYKGYSYQRIRNILLKYSMKKTFEKADLVIFLSNYASSIILGRYKVKVKKSMVISHGVPANFFDNSANSDNDINELKWLFQYNYLLYVSYIDSYKSQIEVIDAFNILKDKYNFDYKLVLIGAEDSRYGKKVRSKIKKENLEKDIFIVKHTLIKYLPSVYKNAVLNIFASQSENCPNTMLEGLASGRPMVASNMPPMTEFGGESVIYFDPVNPLDIAEKIESILFDTEKIKIYGNLAADRANLFKLEHSSNQMWEVIINEAL